MAATSNVRQFVDHLDEKVLECPLCYKRLKDPKTFPCLHTYCLSCLTEWVNKKSKPVCPTCGESFTIPDGGLQKLPPNTFINNLLESIEQLDDVDKKICYCGQNAAHFYCQECMQYICTACKHTHETLPSLLNHKLHTIKDIQSMTITQFSALHPPLCPAHKKELEFYCKVCKVPVCMHCAITDHKEWAGKHETIHISEAFKLFKQTSTELKKNVDVYKQKIQAALTKVHHKTNQLEWCNVSCRKDINNFVEEMIQIIREKGEELNRMLDEVYTKKKKITDTQTDELNTIMLNVDTKWNFIAQLLKSNEATALQSSHNTIKSIQETIQKLPETEPKDNGEMYVNLNTEYHAKTLKQKALGFITETCLEIVTAPTMLTKEQAFECEIVQHSSTKVDSNLLKAILTSPGEETKLETEKHDEGKYVVKSMCRSNGVWKLDVSFGDEPIRGSPLMITVEKQGLINTIDILHGNKPLDVVLDEDGCLLVALKNNEIYRFKQSGEYVSKITLPSKVQVISMYKMKKNGLIVYSDDGNKCITLCKPNGKVIKSIGKGVLKNYNGFNVDEKLNVVYVTDSINECVFMFNMDTNQMIRRIGSRGHSEGELYNPCDVHVTNEGHLIITDCGNHRLQLFDNEGKFMKVLVGDGVKDGKVHGPVSVTIDKDNNMLVTSRNKLQLFNSDGHFIKRIDQKEDGLNVPCGLSIVSYNPRRVAVANKYGRNIKVYNY
ncbi:tripartite motif-containing protein 2-like [Anneissia japonica]|uniref:tripartite motif-containing protein 2-like n=1 Tax=Anneissia japonica TaxID=1529436 RepID=UPI001425884A|nr:tripartite motif-containing protein 2-like [Anneissia japonica]